MSPTPRRVPFSALVLSLILSACAGDDPAPPPPAASEQSETTGSSDDSSAATDTDSADLDAPLWGDEFEARVATPVGVLGPRTEVAIDPREVDGISWDGVWEMERDWDETVDGGYLDFGAAALDVNGHTVLGFRIEVPAGIDNAHVIDGGGSIGHFEITNPQQHAHNSFIRHVDRAHHYIARGVVGDAIKVGEGTSSHHDAYIEMNVLPGGPDDKHYDGAQIFRTGSARLERLVIDWNGAGTIANTTAAIFTQDDASLVARDIIVLDPGGTWQIIRLSGDGPHDVDDVQVAGPQGPNNIQPGNDTPTALVRITNEMERFTLHNDVPGADDWFVDES